MPRTCSTRTFLREASPYFAQAELDRRFKPRSRSSVYGIEPICRVLPIALSTYRDHLARQRDPARLPARAQGDAALAIEVRRVFAENFHVYGVRKVWPQLRREGFDVARCTVARLMR